MEHSDFDEEQKYRNGVFVHGHRYKATLGNALKDKGKFLLILYSYCLNTYSQIPYSKKKKNI